MTITTKGDWMDYCYQRPLYDTMSTIYQIILGWSIINPIILRLLIIYYSPFLYYVLLMIQRTLMPL